MNEVKRVLERCLRLAHLKPDDISDVVFVGGSTRIPHVQEAVREMFPSTTILRHSVNPDTAVARGAMLYFQTNLVVDDCTSYSYGQNITGKGGMKVECIIPKGKKYNTKYSVRNPYGKAVDCIFCKIFQGYAENEGDIENVRDCVQVGSYEINAMDLMEEKDLTEEDMKERVMETSYEMTISGEIIVTVRDVETGFVLLDKYEVKI